MCGSRCVTAGSVGPATAICDSETLGGQQRLVEARATVLALGGASWPRLGSDGAWVQTLGAKGVTISPLRPANCGFTVGWSDIFRDRFERPSAQGGRVDFRIAKPCAARR